MKLIAVYTTVGSLEEARKIAKTLVQRKLVACAQISEIESFYAWKGEVQNDQEFRILLKTTDTRYKAVEVPGRVCPQTLDSSRERRTDHTLLDSLDERWWVSIQHSGGVASGTGAVQPSR